MRCLACGKFLSNKESTRKYASSGTYVDLCNGCFSHVEDDIPVVEGQGEDDDEGWEESIDDEQFDLGDEGPLY